jgi:hypothetical protein
MRAREVEKHVLKHAYNLLNAMLNNIAVAIMQVSKVVVHG